MKLIIKQIFNVVVVLIILILSWMSFVSIYYSPEYLMIKTQNIFNKHLNIDNNISISLPKDWLYLISSKAKSSSQFYLYENFIIDNKLDISKILFTVVTYDNKGIISFKDKKYIEQICKLYDEKYTIHDGKNCIYQVYQKENKIDFIYIPFKKTKLIFENYNKDIPKFIDEFCEE